MAIAAPTKKRATKPRYLQLADELRDAVMRGDFPDGFPTEQVLTDRYHVSRFTIREALRTLMGEGLITRRRGSGTTIMASAQRGGALHQPMSNVGELLQYARDTRFEFERTHDDFGMPPAIEEAIGLEQPGRWLRFHGIRHDADGKPIAQTHAFIHDRLEHIVDDIRPENGTIFSQIENLAGIRIASVTQDIQACAADTELAETLEIEPGDPVLRIIRCYLDAAGQTYEVSASYHPGARFAYAMHHEVGR
ncbi:HTH gntR-type domain-containing protein [Sphingomonas antarctica]|uniref:GntR family transcriptional regulator n=1 Tax=Sphingomonas antarctica TaxID=2040274 RepID=UPI0039EB18AC